MWRVTRGNLHFLTSEIQQTIYNPFTVCYFIFIIWNEEFKLILLNRMNMLKRMLLFYVIKEKQQDIVWREFVHLLMFHYILVQHTN